MKIKQSDILNLWKVFEVLGNEKQGIKFSYFIAKNKSIIKDEVEILQKLIDAPEKYKEFDSKRIEFAKDLADKDEKDEPIVENDAYKLSTNASKFKKLLEALKDEYKDVIKEFEVKITEFNTLVQSEIEFNGYTILIEHLPDEIEPQILELFMNLGLIED